jgi:hypothetical protein
MVRSRRVRQGLEVAVGVAAAIILAMMPTTTDAVALHQDPPSVTNEGTASWPLRLVAIIPRSYPNAGALGRFTKALPKSHWFSSVQTAYPLYSGAPGNLSTLVLYVDDMPGMNTHDRTVATYQDYVFDNVRAAGLKADPRRQSIYVLFIPCTIPHGMDVFGCASHHPAINPSRISPSLEPESDLFRQGDSMAGRLGSDPNLDRATNAVSHEVVEAYTNTNGVGRWHLHSDYPNDPWKDASPWVRGSGTIEMADMSAGSAWYEKDPRSGTTFRYERIYAPYRVAHGFNDWMVPSSPYPQYNVSDTRGVYAHGWHHFVSKGGPTVSIAMTAWAETGVGSYTVTAKVRTSGGSESKPCSLPTATWTVHDGSTFKLKVNTKPLSSGQHVWCSIQLTSTRSLPAAHDDGSHWWVVGILVTTP